MLTLQMTLFFSIELCYKYFVIFQYFILLDTIVDMKVRFYTKKYIDIEKMYQTD